MYAPLIHTIWNIFEVGTVLVLCFSLRGKSKLTSTIGLVGWGWGAFDGSMHSIAKRSGCGLPCNNVRLKKVIEMFVGLTCTQC